MALDDVLLLARDGDRSPTTLRFLEFSPHCVLVGFHQAVELEVEEEYCRAHGIAVNRRLTGGGAIYLDEGQLGWEVVATRADFPGVAGLEGMFARVAECVVAGLRRLGVDAAFRPKNDIEVDGRKLSGTGGTERSHGLIYHGTLLTDFDVDTMLQCLRLPISKLDDKQVQGFRQRVTCLRELLGTAPPLSAIKQALVDGFAEVLGIELVAWRPLGRRAGGVGRAHPLLRVRGVGAGQPRPLPGECAGHGRSQDARWAAAGGDAGRLGARRRQGRLHQRRLLRAARPCRSSTSRRGCGTPPAAPTTYAAGWRRSSRPTTSAYPG